MALMQYLDERDLVEAYKAGDPDAFAAIVLYYRAGLLGDAARRLGDPIAAEDAFQETMLRAYRALDRFNGDYRLGAWLHRILANVCADEQRRRHRSLGAVERLAATRVADAPSADELVADALNAKTVANALQELPPNYRQAFVLREVDELSYQDIAAAAGVTEQNARARVSRARSHLRLMLTSALGVVPAITGRVRRIPRLFGGAGRSAQSALQASAADPTAVQLTARLGESLPAKAVLLSAVAVTVAASYGAPSAPVNVAPHASAIPPAVVVAAPSTASGTAQGVLATQEAPSSTIVVSAPTATSPDAPASSGPSLVNVPGSPTAPVTRGTPTPAAGSTTPTTFPSGSTTPTTAPSTSPAAPPTNSSGGTMTSDPMPLTDPTSCQISTSGSGQLDVSGGTLDGPLSVRGSVPCSDGSTGRLNLLLTFTQSDGTLARVSISGTDVAESSTDSTTTYRFDGTFSSTGGQSQGVPSSGTATGEIVVDRDGATLTTSLTLSAS